MTRPSPPDALGRPAPRLDDAASDDARFDDARSDDARLDDARSDDALTDDALCGAFRVWQRRRGHRYSIDDVATAWEAAGAAPAARRVVDLGTGIGSVALMLAWKLPAAAVVGVEALPLSAALAERNVARNGVADRVRVVRGDLRDPAVSEAIGPGTADLVTGTPPYFPPSAATASPDPQRAHARVELRGGVEDYLAAAGRLVAPAGRVVVCAAAGAERRVRQGAAAAGLAPAARRRVVPREGRKGPLFDLWTLAPAAAAPATPTEHPPLVARDAAGARTPAERALRRFFGLPAGDVA